MEKKKTAVEWFIDSIYLLDSTNWKNIIKQAIEMEKEQIKDAYKAGCVDEMWELNNTESEEHYYNKTYANDTTTGLPKKDSKRRGWHY